MSLWFGISMGLLPKNKTEKYNFKLYLKTFICSLKLSTKAISSYSKRITALDGRLQPAALDK